MRLLVAAGRGERLPKRPGGLGKRNARSRRTTAARRPISSALPSDERSELPSFAL
jgi:hypothetical protein